MPSAFVGLARLLPASSVLLRDSLLVTHRGQLEHPKFAVVYPEDFRSKL